MFAKADKYMRFYVEAEATQKIFQAFRRRAGRSTTHAVVVHLELATLLCISSLLVLKRS